MGHKDRKALRVCEEATRRSLEAFELRVNGTASTAPNPVAEPMDHGTAPTAPVPAAEPAGPPPPPSEPPPDTHVASRERKKIHVANVCPGLSEDEMRHMFSQYGKLEALGMGNEECWITFHRFSDALLAAAALHGCPFGDQELQITVEPLDHM
eukprot:NODE_5672_length_563_cov_274.401575.p1 GENE.NODE_5672_length_563_cov_274.401575~~NODE_5672_length_563_cov_274.401575.p1  ORF type:complete len:153 (+),score=37.29 NODE_5672_length_563_cov_274.401575:3-461(+)